MGSDGLQERWIATTSLLWRCLAEQLNELPIEVPHLLRVDIADEVLALHRVRAIWQHLETAIPDQGASPISTRPHPNVN